MVQKLGWTWTKILLVIVHSIIFHKDSSYKSKLKEIDTEIEDINKKRKFQQSSLGEGLADLDKSFFDCAKNNYYTEMECERLEREIKKIKPDE